MSRYGLPHEDTPQTLDLTVANFKELGDAIDEYEELLPTYLRLDMSAFASAQSEARSRWMQ